MSEAQTDNQKRLQLAQAELQHWERVRGELMQKICENSANLSRALATASSLNVDWLEVTNKLNFAGQSTLDLQAMCGAEEQLAKAREGEKPAADGTLAAAALANARGKRK